MNKVRILTILFIVLTLTAFGCGSSKTNEGAAQGSQVDNYDDEQRTQMGSEGTGDWQDSGDLDWSGDNTNTPPSGNTGTTYTPPAGGSGMLGYRVQIAAMSTENAARQAAQKAANVLNVKGYIEFEGGLWKVRMGNARTREEAEILRDYAKGKGYSDAWIVESEIKSE